MLEQLPQNEKQEPNIIEDAAIDAGLRRGVVLPKEGTGAYDNLKDTCERYSNIVSSEMRTTSANLLTSSEKKSQSPACKALRYVVRHILARYSERGCRSGGSFCSLCGWPAVSGGRG